MTTIYDIPNNILIEIFKKNLDFFTIRKLCLVNTEFNDIINKNYEDIIINLYKYQHSAFINIILKKNIYFSDSDINIDKFFKLLSNLEIISNMKKGTRYQYMLKDIYNVNLFIFKNYNDIEDLHYKESCTLSILISFLDIVKKMSILKTNLVPWAMYILINYIVLSINHKKRVNHTIFLGSDYHTIIINKIYNIRIELKNIRNCSTNIKYKLEKIINLISDVFIF